MKYDKAYLRKKSLLLRKKKYLKPKNFNFGLIFKLIRKHFYNKKIIIAGYYPSNYEVDILNFIEEASMRKFKIALPFIKSSNIMSFKSWIFKEPLNVSKFGILEPKSSNAEIIPDLVLVPLVAFDNQLNRIGVLTFVQSLHIGPGTCARVLGKTLQGNTKEIPRKSQGNPKEIPRKSIYYIL